MDYVATANRQWDEASRKIVDGGESGCRDRTQIDQRLVWEEKVFSSKIIFAHNEANQISGSNRDNKNNERRQITIINGDKPKDYVYTMNELHVVCCCRPRDISIRDFHVCFYAKCTHTQKHIGKHKHSHTHTAKKHTRQHSDYLLCYCPKTMNACDSNQDCVN